jgi:hypothetical protein
MNKYLLSQRVHVLGILYAIWDNLDEESKKYGTIPISDFYISIAETACVPVQMIKVAEVIIIHYIHIKSFH